MLSEKNDLNYRKSECYVKSDRAEGTGTFRLKTDKNKQKRCGGKKKN